MNSNRSDTWQWDNPTIFATSGFMLMTMVAVGEIVREIPLYSRFFKELGIQLPQMTEVALTPWIHLAMGVILLVPLFLRHRTGWKPRSTAVWIVVLLVYLALSHVAFFMPLIKLVEVIGKSVNG